MTSKKWLFAVLLLVASVGFDGMHILSSGFGRETVSFNYLTNNLFFYPYSALPVARDGK